MLIVFNETLLTLKLLRGFGREMGSGRVVFRDMIMARIITIS